MLRSDVGPETIRACVVPAVVAVAVGVLVQAMGWVVLSQTVVERRSSSTAVVERVDGREVWFLLG